MEYHEIVPMLDEQEPNQAQQGTNDLRARPLVRKPHPTPVESAARRGQIASNTIDSLVIAVRTIDSAATRLGAGDILLSSDQSKIVLTAAARLQSNAEWIQTLINDRGRL